MAIPNIPSVSTSVIDRSETTPVINGHRTSLVPIFSKYGKEDFVQFTDIKSLNYSIGKENIKKYGKSVSYAKLAAQQNQVLVYRLLPSDATYANACILDDILNTFISYQSIHTKDDMVYTPPLIDGTLTSQVSDKVVLSALAASRGEGYNSIFISFEPAIDYEKRFNNSRGESSYRFNFLSAVVFEQTPEGKKILGDPIVFSLIENDAITSSAILDPTTGNDLFVNNVFKDANEFATLNVNSAYSDQMAAAATIDQVVTKRVIVEDKVVAGRYYEIKVETYDKIVVDSNSVEQVIPAQRLAAVVTSDAPTESLINYKDADGVQKAIRMDVTDSVISFPDAPPTSDNLPDSLTVDGTDAFYAITIKEDGTPNIEEVKFLRHSIYKKLITYTIALSSGSDGSYMQVNNEFNITTTTTEVGKQTPKMLLTDFYNNNKFLKEVLYPKYDFDYVPDWSEDLEVETAMIRLADTIGITMPILSLPLTYDPTLVTKDLPDKDLKMRKEKLFQSSYNSALYSGQRNKTHRNSNSTRMYMPASYYALAAHLRIDNDYSITEPVANVIKGVLDETNINLTYAPTSYEIEKLRDQQINTIIDEPDGVYFIDQLTMYKKKSKLSYINIVKVIHRIRKDLPKVLKDLLQNKAIDSIIDKAVIRAEATLNKWVISPNNVLNGLFKTATVNANYNEKLDKLRLTVVVNPVGTIESIDIPIIVI